jgi:hypothetical protein
MSFTPFTHATREGPRPTSVPWGNDAKTGRPCLARTNGAGPMLFIPRVAPRPGVGACSSQATAGVQDDRSRMAETSER